jgi:hypothetical protein
MEGVKTRAVECRDLQTESLAEDCDQHDKPSGNKDSLKGQQKVVLDLWYIADNRHAPRYFRSFPFSQASPRRTLQQITKKPFDPEKNYLNIDKDLKASLLLNNSLKVFYPKLGDKNSTTVSRSMYCKQIV